VKSEKFGTHLGQHWGMVCQTAESYLCTNCHICWNCQISRQFRIADHNVIDDGEPLDRGESRQEVEQILVNYLVYKESQIRGVTNLAPEMGDEKLICPFS
jgi:hypothetical protein